VTTSVRFAATILPATMPSTAFSSSASFAASAGPPSSITFAIQESSPAARSRETIA